MYNEVKQDYTYELNKKFEENKEKLIESFIEYYGKEFEDRIMNIYSDILCWSKYYWPSKYL